MEARVEIGVQPPLARVLVVDDELEIRKFVTRVLQDAGYLTDDCGSGADALKRIADGERFGLVVTDVRMPSMSGPQFVERLTQADRDVKVLYLTGYNEQLFREKTTLWADEAFLDKPFSVKGLLEAVSMLVYGHLAPGQRPVPSHAWLQ
jgi:two-component system cell cycle sensor histidine kinase/response regulator CckA